MDNSKDIFIISDDDLDLANSSVSCIGANIIEYLNAINKLRHKSRKLQGPISGKMKNLLIKIKETVSTLTGRYESTADVFLKMCNKELTVNYNAMEKEI